VIAGAYDIVIAAGVESMSWVPMGTSAGIGGQPFGPTMMQR
jgi:acetyl-CoA acyltransferase